MNTHIIKVLGSGSSTGLPIVGCKCKVCLSTNKKDKRTRASLFFKNLSENSTGIIIDTGPDFREQCLRNSIDQLDSVLYTHAHYDHIGGIDDLRSFTFSSQKPIFCYMDITTKTILEKRNSYIFQKIQGLPKLTNIPNLVIKTLQQETVDYFKNFHINNIKIQPISLMHDPVSNFPSVGYVFQEKFGYLTDFKYIQEESKQFLYNLDILYLGSPVPFKHKNHISIPEALSLFQEFQPKKGYIGHLAHYLLHKDLQKQMPKNVQVAYDGLEFSF